MDKIAEIKALANQIIAAKKDGENTAERVGSALLQLANLLEQLPYAKRASFEARPHGLYLVLHNNVGQADTVATEVQIPILNGDQAGIMTPKIAKEWQTLIADMTDTLTAKDNLLQKEIDALRQFVNESNTAEAAKFEEERRSIEQLLESKNEGGGVYILKNVLSPQSLNILRQKYPHLTIKNPLWTGFVFDERLPLGVFTQNLENKTGNGTGRPLTPSGHLSAIMDQFERVLVKRKEGKVYMTKMQKDNHTLYPDGTETKSNGNEEYFIRIPRHYYKGVSDYFFGANYFFVASEKPNPANGVKTTENQLTKVAGKGVSIADEYIHIDTALQNNEQYNVWRVPVEGYRYVNFPSAKFSEREGKVYGTLYVDKYGNRTGHTVAPIGINKEDVGFVDGMRFVSQIPSGTTDMYFTLPASMSPEYVWLTKSEEIYDREPDFFEFPETLIAVFQSKPFSIKPNSSYRWSHSDHLTLEDAKKISSQLGEGWSIMTYDTYNAIVNLHYALHGERLTLVNVGGSNDKNALLYPITQKVTANNFKKYINGIETNTAIILGLSSPSYEWLDGLSKSTTHYSVDSTKIPLLDISYNNFDRVFWGAGAHNLPLRAGGTISSNYGNMAVLRNGDFFFLLSTYWVHGCFSFGTANNTQTCGYRLQYRGDIVELSSDDFKAL